MLKPSGKPNKTQRQKAASRANGAKGGRPRDVVPDAVMRKLGNPPLEDPLALSRWWSSALTLCFIERAAGRISDRMFDAARAACSAGTKSIPADILVAVEKALRDDEQARNQAEGAEMENLDDGSDGTPRAFRGQAS